MIFRSHIITVINVVGDVFAVGIVNHLSQSDWDGPQYAQQAAMSEMESRKED